MRWAILFTGIVVAFPAFQLGSMVDDLIENIGREARPVRLQAVELDWATDTWTLERKVRSDTVGKWSLGIFHDGGGPFVAGCLSDGPADFTTLEPRLQTWPIGPTQFPPECIENLISKSGPYRAVFTVQPISGRPELIRSEKTFEAADVLEWKRQLAKSPP